MRGVKVVSVESSLLSGCCASCCCCRRRCCSSLWKRCIITFQSLLYDSATRFFSSFATTSAPSPPLASYGRGAMFSDFKYRIRILLAFVGLASVISLPPPMPLLAPAQPAGPSPKREPMPLLPAPGIPLIACIG